MNLFYIGDIILVFYFMIGLVILNLYIIAP